jgi:hypothetical protein
MFDVVKIGDKDVPMLAMASVDVFYRNIFHDDPIIAQTRNQDEGSAILFFEQMERVFDKPGFTHSAWRSKSDVATIPQCFHQICSLLFPVTEVLRRFISCNKKGVF